ncbi:MAG TPA: type II toxin-antitoxin system RelB/DinJ family antitoxin, partial [Clostridia bacterium]|nr:type II toxin-antitoxin system RelB/DinJ family antitoxin [Clostridia bacterium]
MMARVEVNIDDITLVEAEDVLKNIGLDLDMAINIFLRRIVLEKALPISMNLKENQSDALKVGEGGNIIVSNEKGEPFQRSITREMVGEVWGAFLKYYNFSDEISRLSDEVSKISGMNRGSASIYLNFLSNLIKGEPNKRNMKITDLKYLLNKV